MSEGNGNGGAGKNTKAFDIVPHEEDCSSIAPRLRKAGRTDANLTHGAKVLFDHLTDESFLYSVSPARGVVKKSAPKLADELKCSVRSIARYRVELEARRYIWTRTVWHGGFELIFWHIRGMAKGQAEFWGDADPSWGKSKASRRRRPQRGPDGQFVSYGEPQENQPVLPQLTVANGQPCPASTDSPVPQQGTALSVVDGQPCPLPTDSTVHQSGPILSVKAGQDCPAPMANSVRGLRTAVSVQEESPTDNRSQDGTSLSVQRVSPLEKSAGRGRKINAENLFLLDVGAMMEHWRKGTSKAELANSGGWWRMGFRNDPDLMRRVLAETLSMVKEAKIKQTPGQAAADLWKRWGGRQTEGASGGSCWP